MAATLRSGPAEVTIDPLGTPVVLEKDDQLSDAKLSSNQDTFELKTQQSTKAIAYVVTGIEFMLMLSIADISLAQIALVFRGTIITDATVSTKKKVLITDNTGLKVVGKKIVLKPYIGDATDSNANNYVTFPNGQLKDPNGTELGFGNTTQQQLQVTFVSMPDVSGVRVIFGDETAVAA